MVDWLLDRGIPILIGVLFALIFVGIISVAYDAVVAETFSLRKDAWKCTAQHVEITSYWVPVGDKGAGFVNTVPTTVCDQWSRT